MFAGNFAPAGWAFCSGQLLPISENDALFTLIGTTYGGDGQETFALPDLQGRIPIHQSIGQSSGFLIGEKGGTEAETLTTQQMPIHSHPPLCLTANGTQGPGNGLWAQLNPPQNIYSNAAPGVNMNPNAVGSAGGSQPHDNMMPYQVISFIISLYGVFPQQS
jgi:microcystin-dependent protein